MNSILLVVAGSFLFFLSHCNFIFLSGVPLAGYFCLIPVFFAIKKSNIKFCMLLGTVFGALSYGLFSFWLVNYGILYLILVILIHAAFHAFLFAVMKFVSARFACSDVWFMALIWCAFEYVKSIGPLGFNYGVLGYSQWRFLPVLLCASVGGVWVASFFCAFFSAAVVRSFEWYKNGSRKHIAACFSILSAIFFCFCLWGFIMDESRAKIEDSNGSKKYLSILAVQNNADSHKYKGDVYKQDIANLVSLTKQGLALHPDVDFIVWPETAVVPSVIDNYTSRKDYGRFNAVSSVLGLINTSDACFVIGNQHIEHVPAMHEDYSEQVVISESGEIIDKPEGVGEAEDFKEYYNSALIFEKNVTKIVPPEPEMYSKIHLVPFTESLPFYSVFHKIYDVIVKDQSFVWSSGSRYRVFDYKNLNFSVPVCFEDTFGSECRKFVKNGAECFFNISNDSWSRSKTCQRQHLAMSVFRCAENDVPMVRSTASGITCFIDCSGRVVSHAAEFSKEWLYGEISVPRHKVLTFYTAYGDWFACLEVCVSLWLIVTALIKKLDGTFKQNMVSEIETETDSKVDTDSETDSEN